MVTETLIINGCPKKLADIFKDIFSIHSQGIKCRIRINCGDSVGDVYYKIEEIDPDKVLLMIEKNGTYKNTKKV